MLKPEEVRGVLLPDAYIKEHGVSYYSLADEYYYDENGVYHYERMFDKPMDEGGKPFTGVVFETFENSDQIAFYTEYQDGYQFGNHAKFYENGALRCYCRIDEKEYYTYEWHENGVLKKIFEMTEWYRKHKQNYYRIREYDENGVLRKTKETRYRKHGQDSFCIREYDENGKLIHKSSD